MGEQRRSEAGKHENFGRQRYTNLIDKMHHRSLRVGQRLPSFVRLPHTIVLTPIWRLIEHHEHHLVGAAIRHDGRNL